MDNYFEDRRDKKIYWVSTQELDNIHNGPREIEIFCPRCNQKNVYGLSNGDVFDIVMSSMKISCPFCNEDFEIIWKGEYDERQIYGIDDDNDYDS